MSSGPEWNPAAVSYGDVEKQSFDILALFRRRIWLILFMVVVAVGLGLLYYNKAPRVYETFARILISKQQAESRDPLAPLEGGPGYQENLSTHIDVIKSPVIIGDAIKRSKLGDLPSLKDIPPQQLPIVIMGGLVTGRAGGRENLDSQVIQINYQSTNVNDAMSVVKAIIEAYQFHLTDQYEEVSQAVVDFMKEAEDKLSSKLSKESAAIAEAEARTPIGVKFGNPVTKAEQDHDAYAADLMILLKRRDGINTLIESVEEAQKNNVSSDVILMQLQTSDLARREQVQDPADAMRMNLFSLSLDHTQMLAKYGPSHPRVKEIELRIQAVEQYIDGLKLDAESVRRQQRTPAQEIAQYLESLRFDLTELDKDEVKLKAHMKAAQAEDEQLKIAKQNLIRLHDEKARTQRLFDEVVKKFSEIELVKGRGGYKLKTIAPPESSKQVEPIIWKVLSVAVFGGLVVGLGLAYLVDMADKSFRNPEEVRHELGVPILGHLPIIAPEKIRKRKGEAPSPVGEMVLTFHRPKSTTAEAYRAVRTALNFGIRGEGHKVIQITSPDPGDGKSTLSSNLAVCMAQSGKRVLLVDADFRRPRVHKLFNIEPTIGLSNVIKGTADLSEAVTETDVDGLSLLPCGPRPANPSELLTSSRFSEMIHVLREQYDIVLIDTPPVLAVTDPCVVAPRVDGVVMLIRITKHVRPHAKRALESLESLGANLLGIVVNGVGGVRPGVGYGFASQYGHRYATNSGYYDSNSYNYGAYHHYYDDEDEQSPTEDQVEEAETRRSRKSRSSAQDDVTLDD